MVLIVSQNKSNAVAISHIFYYMRVLSYPCTPSTALSEISTLYRAVLVIEPNDLPDTADFVKRLRDKAPVPVFAVAKEPKKCKSPYAFDEVYRDAILSGNLYYLINKYLEEHGFPLIGIYRYAGLDVSCDKKIPTHYFRNTIITTTERMILSFLVIAKDEQQEPKNIIKYAFRHGRNPDISCVRSHISSINKKFNQSGSLNIIGNNPGTGYYILTAANRHVKLRKKDKTSHIVL